jgi:microcystin degradation protein MlrC
MRFAVGGIFNETNTFAAPVTDISAFTIRRGEACLDLAGANHSLGGAIDACRELGIEAVPTIYADSLATGTTARPIFEALLDELAERIISAGPLDGIALALHGAMVAEGHPDADAAIVQRVREVVGSGVPIAVAVDFHANIGQPMLDAADIVTVYDTYPHCDQAERAREAVALLARTARGEIRPVTALVKPPMMPVPQGQHTEQPPFRDLLARAHEIEARGDALIVSVAGGFAYADVPEAGLSVLATTDGDPALAHAIASDLARQAWNARDRMAVHNVPVADAVAEAIAFPGGPVMLVDVGDNIGGGTPGDGTALLAELLRQGARGAIMVIADREAVALAARAGVGGLLEATVGGKTDRWHGDPVPVRGRVRSIGDGRWVHEGPEWAGVPVEMGTTAVVDVDGVTLVLTERATAPGDQQQLKSLGITPTEQRIIVVKAAVRWRGGYGPIARHAIHVDTPGLGSANLAGFPYHHIRRPIWPLDADAAWPHPA